MSFKKTKSDDRMSNNGSNTKNIMIGLGELCLQSVSLEAGINS